MKLMYKNGITRHVSDAEAARLKTFGYEELKPEEPKKEPEAPSEAADADDQASEPEEKSKKATSKKKG